MKNLDFILAEMSQWKCTRQRSNTDLCFRNLSGCKMGRRSQGKALALVWTAEDESLNSGSRAEDGVGCLRDTWSIELMGLSILSRRTPGQKEFRKVLSF